MGLYSKHVNVFIICNWKIRKTPNWNVLAFVCSFFKNVLKFAIIKRQVMFRIFLGVLHCVFCLSIRVGSGLSQSCKPTRMMWGRQVVSTTAWLWWNPKLTLPLSTFFLASPFNCTSAGNGWEDFPSCSFSRYSLVSVWKFAVVYLYKYTQCYWSQFVSSSLMVFRFGFFVCKWVLWWFSLLRKIKTVFFSMDM